MGLLQRVYSRTREVYTSSVQKLTWSKQDQRSNTATLPWDAYTSRHENLENLHREEPAVQVSLTRGGEIVWNSKLCLRPHHVVSQGEDQEQVSIGSWSLEKEERRRRAAGAELLTGRRNKAFRVVLVRPSKETPAFDWFFLFFLEQRAYDFASHPAQIGGSPLPWAILLGMHVVVKDMYHAWLHGKHYYILYVCKMCISLPLAGRVWERWVGKCLHATCSIINHRWPGQDRRINYWTGHSTGYFSSSPACIGLILTSSSCISMTMSISHTW